MQNHWNNREWSIILHAITVTIGITAMLFRLVRTSLTRLGWIEAFQFLPSCSYLSIYLFFKRFDFSNFAHHFPNHEAISKNRKDFTTVSLGIFLGDAVMRKLFPPCREIQKNQKKKRYFLRPEHICGSAELAYFNFPNLSIVYKVIKMKKTKRKSPKSTRLYVSAVQVRLIRRARPIVRPTHRPVRAGLRAVQRGGRAYADGCQTRPPVSGRQGRRGRRWPLAVSIRGRRPGAAYRGRWCRGRCAVLLASGRRVQAHRRHFRQRTGPGRRSPRHRRSLHAHDGQYNLRSYASQTISISSLSFCLLCTLRLNSNVVKGRPQRPHLPSPLAV